MGVLKRQYTAAISCLLACLMTGAGFAWFAPLMSWLTSSESEIPMTKEETSWLVASIEFGAVISPIPAGIIADRIGRKWVLLSTAPLYLSAWMLVVLTRSKAMLLLVRAVQGFCDGIVYAVGPVYVAEIAQPTIRGELIGQLQTIWYMGNLYSYCTGPYLTYQNYAFACALLPCVFFLSFMSMPESPYFLIMSGKRLEAEESLKWLRARVDVSEELDVIEEAVKEDLKNKGSWYDLIATKADIKALLIVESVCVVKYYSGMVAVLTYSTQTFSESTEGLLNEYQLTILIGVVLAGSTLGAAYISDSIGRKPLLILSCIGSMIFSGVIGTYYFIETQTSYDPSAFTWTMNLSVILFCIVNSIGLGPLMQTIQAEFFPSHTRSFGGGVTGIVASTTSFFVLKQYQFVTDQVGVYLNFWVFAFFSFIGSIILYIVFPETAGKSLGEIQSDMRKTKS